MATTQAAPKTAAKTAAPRPKAPAKAEPKAKVTKDGKLAKAPKVPRACRCGCGRTTLSVYAQGHDAKHVTQLRAAVIEGKLTQAEAVAKLDSVKLVSKLTHSLELHYEAERKREQAAKAKAAEKAASAKAASKEA